MIHFPKSSRLQLSDFRERFKQRKQAKQDGTKPQGTSRHRSSWQLIKEFFRLLRPERRAVVFALITLSTATLLKLFPPAATKFVIDHVLGEKPIPASWPDWITGISDKYALLYLFSAAVVAISLVGHFIHLAGRWTATQATKRMQLAMRRLTFDHAVRLPLHRVYELKSGGATSILRDDAGGVAELIFGLLYNPCQAAIQLAGSLAILAIVDWRLLIGALALVPLVFYTHRTWIGRIRPLHKEVRLQRQEIDAQATEAFGGMRVVRAFGREQSESMRFTFSNHGMARKELLGWWWARGIELIWDTLIPMASAGLILYGGSRVLSHALTIGDLMMFLIYLAMLLEPLAKLANSATVLQTSLAGFDRVLDLLEEPTEVSPSPALTVIQPWQVRGAVALENVRFKYPKAEKEALAGISLEIEEGETVALVGASGAGKTTLCNLVARFYDPTQGRILLDGQDLKTIRLANYRRLFGIVEQEVFLFDGTVAENISYARRHATRDQVEAAAKVAHAHAFVCDMDKGYDTLIGERGVRLSGGQRQRLAIARAVLADPKILILDEATSNLDTESERLIQQSLLDVMRRRTCLVIAHRLSTIRHADRIVVMEGGQIVETGTHQSLMQGSTRYRRMVQQQVLGITPTEDLEELAGAPQTPLKA